MKIHPYLDLHGDAICFGIRKKNGEEIERVISENDALLALLMAEARAEDDEWEKVRERRQKANSF
jgi:hypothetical protein